MARDTTDLTPVESVDELVEWLAAGEKPKSRWRLGTEHEKFPFYVEGNKPFPYAGPRGIKALLEGMQAMLNSRGIRQFHANDEELLVRHLHKVVADSVSAGENNKGDGI